MVSPSSFNVALDAHNRDNARLGTLSEEDELLREKT